MRAATRTRRNWMLISAATAGAILLLTFPGRGSERRPSCRSTLIPAYVPPAAIAYLAAGSPGPRLLIVNPSTGPGVAEDPSYRDAVRAAQAAGARVLGYVPTTYGARALAEVEADIDRYASWYGVDGIFLDEAARGEAQLAYYRELSRHIRSAGRRLVVLNPGMVPSRAYFGLADVVVTFEGPFADYAARVERMPAWVRDVPPEHIAHLIYAASRQQALQAVDADALARYLYVTSGSLPDPWRTVPDYLREEEAALGACS